MTTPMPQAAVLWDESYLWGLMTVRALQEAGLAFRLLTADEVASGALARTRLLFVPGGWARHKATRLGERGADQVRGFVRDGGLYVGVCGGAGLALLDDGGLGLLPVHRVARAQRVPAFAGAITLHPHDACHGASHWLWRGLGDTETLWAWWPSQLAVDPQDEQVQVVARYGQPGSDATTSDLVVADVAEAGLDWRELEQSYGIRLDPARMLGAPAILCGRYGAGRVVLSLPHMDMPASTAGATLLRRLWQEADIPLDPPTRPRSSVRAEPARNRGTERLMELGIRNHLWRWRPEPAAPRLLAWRRGVRGFECCTLHAIATEIESLLAVVQPRDAEVRARLSHAQSAVAAFVRQACHLLVRERMWLNAGTSQQQALASPEITQLRVALFGEHKRHGGSFKQLLETLDSLVLELLVEH